MARRVLDTSVLIRHWQRSCAAENHRTAEAARRWASELIDVRLNNAVVTPVCIEFLCGVRSSQELQLARAFLAAFRVIDDGRILTEDTARARRYAERVPRSGRPRDLGDCLIRAIADRYGYDVDTLDAAFP